MAGLGLFDQKGAIAATAFWVVSRSKTGFGVFD
jgi:hypothetical protein